jgi:hypothetical protein
MKPPYKRYNEIKEFTDTHAALGVIEELKELWINMGSLKFTKRGNKWWLQLHTGGWSENEELIDNLSKSFFWNMYWQKSERGGHYYFKGSL